MNIPFESEQKQKWVIPEKIHTPLEILAGGGVHSSGNPGGSGDLNRKILPQGSLLTLTLIDISEPLKKELCIGKFCSL